MRESLLQGKEDATFELELSPNVHFMTGDMLLEDFGLLYLEVWGKYIGPFIHSEFGALILKFYGLEPDFESSKWVESRAVGRINFGHICLLSKKSYGRTPLRYGTISKCFEI